MIYKLNKFGVDSNWYYDIIEEEDSEFDEEEDFRTYEEAKQFVIGLYEETIDDYQSMLDHLKQAATFEDYEDDDYEEDDED